MIKADFHNHSTVSDGSMTMEEILDEAVKRNLDAVAITDHDTVSHIKKLPKRKGLRVIGGIEVSCFDKKENLRAHILGYNIKNTELLGNVVEITLKRRHENCLKQIEMLTKAGYKIDIDKLRKADGKYIYKQHIMDYLVRTNQAPDMFGEFYQRIFKNNGICDFDIEYLEPVTAVRAIKEAGGLAVLAHSGQQQNFCLIQELTENGLDGLELNHPANSNKDKEIIREYAEEFNLFMTGGSDSHGLFEKNSSAIGDFLSDRSGYEAILAEREYDKRSRY